MATLHKVKGQHGRKQTPNSRRGQHVYGTSLAQDNDEKSNTNRCKQRHGIAKYGARGDPITNHQGDPYTSRSDGNGGNGTDPFTEQHPGQYRCKKWNGAHGEDSIGNCRVGNGEHIADHRTAEEHTAKDTQPTDASNGVEGCATMLNKQDYKHSHGKGYAAPEHDLPFGRRLQTANQNAAGANDGCAKDD